MKNISRLAFLLLYFFSYSKISNACSPIAVPTLVSQTIVGSNLNLMWSSNTIYNSCSYLIQVEIVCNSATFPGNGNPPFYQSATIFKTTTPFAYPLQSINIAPLCPGTLYKFRARECSSSNLAVFSPWTATFTFTTPGVFVQPTVTVTGSPLSVCVPQTSQLNCTITNGCGPTAPTFAWAPAASLNNATIANPIASPTTTTTYTCNVTGGLQGCWTASGTVTITTTVPPIAGTASVSPLAICAGNPVTLTLVGYTGTIQWQSGPTSVGPWTNIVGATTSPYVTSALFANTCFQAIVTGCSSATSNVVCITINPGPSSTQAVTNLSCNGVCNGVGTITPNPAGAYTYAWSPNVGSTATVSALCAGTYSVTATDIGGCFTTQTITITQPPVLAATFTQGNVSCFGGTNGTASITMSGGTPGYSFSWSPAVANSTVGNTNTATGLSAGTYVVTATDAMGCTFPQSIIITQPPALAGTFAQTNVSCNAGADGTASITMSGGTGPYTFGWSPAVINSTVGNTNTATGLSASTYVVTATDALGCTFTNTFTIGQNSALASLNTQVDVTCTGLCNASASVSISGGSPGYSYFWTPSSQITPTATSLCAGNYSCLITDLNGCTLTQAFTITEPTPLTLTSAGFNVTCNGVCDGQLAVIPAGGTPNYGFSWSTGCLTASCNNVCAGTYVVTVTDLNGCVATSTATVTEPTAVIVTATSIDANCGLPDGSATCTFSGGTGGLTPVWYNPMTPGTNLTNVYAGNYFVVVTDANGCDDTASVTINSTPGVNASAGTITPVSCFGGNNGSATLNISGGSGTITYVWNCSASTTNTASNLIAGACNVVVTDSIGCTSTVNFTITEPPLLTISSTANPGAICVGQSSTITATGGGGTLAYSYAWTPGPMSGSVQTVSPIATQVYTVVITDANFCIDSSTVTVTVNPNPVVAFAGDSLSGCVTHCLNFSDSSTLSSGTINQWTWDFGDSSPISTQQNPTHCYQSAGTYSVMLTVSTSAGCTSTITMPNYITVYGNPIADFSSFPQPTTELNPEIFFTDLSTNANSWNWNFGDGLGNSTLQNPSYDYGGPGCFDVVLTVTTINNCIDTSVHEICIDPDVTLFVPNAFTPNGNGRNELFFPQGVGLDPDHFEMWIFDRWGNMIFFTDDMTKGWNGCVQGNTELCQEDTYVWKIKVTDLMGNKHNLIGHVSLIK